MILCGVALTPCAQGQRAAYIAHNRLLDSALALMSSVRYADAISVYEDAFVVMPWCPARYFEPVMASLSIGDAERANHFLSVGVQYGFEPTLFTGANDLIQHLASDASLPFRERWQQDKLVFGAVADSAFIKELDSLRQEDQRYGRMEETMEATRHIDSLNFEHLIRFCERNGFPNSKYLGHSFGIVFLLLWHHRGPEYPGSPQWQRILPFMRAAMEAGDLDPSFLCMFDDFSDQDAGRPMRFGALLSYFSQYPEKLFFVPRAELNKNRASVGWGPLDDFARTVGVDLNKVRFAEP